MILVIFGDENLIRNSVIGTKKTKGLIKKNKIFFCNLNKLAKDSFDGLMTSDEILRPLAYTNIKSSNKCTQKYCGYRYFFDFAVQSKSYHINSHY